MMINGVQSLDGNEFINSTQCDGLFDFQLSNNISSISNISSSDISSSDFNVETYLKLIFIYILVGDEGDERDKRDEKCKLYMRKKEAQ